MSRQANYFKIGLFMVVGLVLLIAATIIFGAGTLFERNVIVETYFSQSVQGLDVGSPVKFRGVKIGEVNEIGLVGDVYDFSFNEDDFFNYGQYVLIRIGLEPDVFQTYSSEELELLFDKMIERGLRLRLSYLGITGLAYLEADYMDPEENPPMEVSWEPDHYHIPAVPNIIARLDESLNDLLKTVDEDFFPMMKNLNAASKDFPQITSRLDEVLRQITPTLKNLKELSASAKKYPSQFVFGDAPPKSRFDR